MTILYGISFYGHTPFASTHVLRLCIPPRAQNYYITLFSIVNNFLLSFVCFLTAMFRRWFGIRLARVAQNVSLTESGHGEFEFHMGTLHDGRRMSITIFQFFATNVFVTDAAKEHCVLISFDKSLWIWHVACLRALLTGIALVLGRRKTWFTKGGFATRNFTVTQKDKHLFHILEE